MRLKLPTLPLKFPVALPGQGLSLFQEREATPVKRVILLAVWGLIVFSLCLGMRLASARFADALRAGLPPQTGLRLAAKGVTPLAFPPGAFAESLTLLDAQGRPLVRLDAATVRLSLWSLATGRLGITVNSLVRDGELDATIASGFLFDTGAIKADADLQALPLDAVPALSALDKHIKGTLDGTVAYAAALDDPLAADAEASLVASALDVVNFVPLMTPKRLPAIDVLLEARSEDGVATIERFEATAKNMRVTGQGQVGIDPKTPKDSTLDLDLTLSMAPSLIIRQLIQPEDYQRLKQGTPLTARLSGTIDRPRISSR